MNGPIAGPTHEKTLLVGDKPIQLYSLGTPNGILARQKGRNQVSVAPANED